jgi:hypothetical protein
MTTGEVVPSKILLLETRLRDKGFQEATPSPFVLEVQFLNSGDMSQKAHRKSDLQLAVLRELSVVHEQLNFVNLLDKRY